MVKKRRAEGLKMACGFKMCNVYRLNLATGVVLCSTE